MAGSYAWCALPADLCRSTRSEQHRKPVIVRDLAREFGGLVFWHDSGNHIWKPMTSLWRRIAAEGVVSTFTPGSIRQFVHPGMMEHLRVPAEHRGNGGMCNGAVIGFHVGQLETAIEVLEPVRHFSRPAPEIEVIVSTVV